MSEEELNVLDDFLSHLLETYPDLTPSTVYTILIDSLAMIAKNNKVPRSLEKEEQSAEAVLVGVTDDGNSTEEIEGCRDVTKTHKSPLQK